jgi:hypothetical protein
MRTGTKRSRDLDGRRPSATEKEHAMGTIVAVEYVSLDGVMESPAWSMPYFNEELQQFQYDNLFGADALLLGRVTYDGFRTSWPSMSDEKGSRTG